MPLVGVAVGVLYDVLDALDDAVKGGCGTGTEIACPWLPLRAAFATSLSAASRASLLTCAPANVVRAASSAAFLWCVLSWASGGVMNGRLLACTHPINAHTGISVNPPPPQYCMVSVCPSTP